MKLKRIFAGMTAAAIASSCLAMTSATTASADTVVTGNAGIMFQTNETWNYRNAYNADDQSAAFPAKTVGVQGGAYGLDTEVGFEDTAINGDGTYTVSMPTSGTIDADNTASTSSNFYLNDDKTLSRAGSTWSMLKNSEPSEDNSSDVTQDSMAWSDGKTTDVFNLLSVATDIPCEFKENDEGVAVPYVNGTEVSVSNIKVDMCGTTYTADTAYFQSESEYLEIMLINKWSDSGANDAIESTALPTQDGTITITFTLSGLGSAATSSADTSSAADTTSSAADTTSSAADTTSSTASTSGTASKASTTSSATSSTASDATAESGAPAGIALALAAVAGAAIVVSRKKD